MEKKNIVLIISFVILLLGFIIILMSRKGKAPKEEKYTLIDNPNSSYAYINNYEEYIDFVTYHENYKLTKELDFDDFNTKRFLFYSTSIDSCGEKIKNDRLEKTDDKYNIYFDVEYRCGVCAPKYVTYIYEVEDTTLDVFAYSRAVSRKKCDPNVSYKPIIYIYPEYETDLTVKLGNTNNLLYTYPKYRREWNVKVSKDGNIYDYDTKRNYYGLYWEALDDYTLDMSKGFVVKGEDTTKFLEEKLAILGLNDYEINEFIIYWIDKLESNKYNFISFRSLDDINKSMPLEFNKQPDTLIRVMMDFKALDSYIDVPAQQLTKVDRQGFTVVEWGGTYHK